jgi:hypothetical protein
LESAIILQAWDVLSSPSNGVFCLLLDARVKQLALRLLRWVPLLLLKTESFIAPPAFSLWLIARSWKVVRVVR